MASKIKLVCNAASDGARAVVAKLNELGTAAIKVRTFNPRLNRALLVAWGTDVDGVHLNKPDALRRARDKLTTFLTLNGAGVPVPKFFNVKAEAERARQAGDIWLARTRNGTGGSGITVVRDGVALPAAQLYVKYTPKQREFRAHVFRVPGQDPKVIHLQEKKRKQGVEQTNDQKLIRSHDNGWVFCEQNLDVSATLRAKIEQVSTAALTALGLDFAAFDLILTKDGRNVLVLEANTRPGVESSGTASAYAGAFISAAAANARR